MVFYGEVSRGCQRCRQRKVKCDERKPGCLRCEKLKTPCPGFRNLSDVMFRDESKRIIRHAHRQYGEVVITHPEPPNTLEKVPHISLGSYSSVGIPRGLGQSVDEAGATFFFNHYSCSGPPTLNMESCDTWLAKIYTGDQAIKSLRLAVEAAGMAGLANVIHAPLMALRAKESYVRALAAMQTALRDPTTSTADTTVMTVMVLGLFEFITFETWDWLRSWTAHIDGAIALLQLRGPQQFHEERSGQLLKQASAQMLYVCMQEYQPVPQALVHIRREFERTIGDRRKLKKPEPLSYLCFRFLDLRAAIKIASASDTVIAQSIHEEAEALDLDLSAWKENLPPVWSYDTAPGDGIGSGFSIFNGKRHVYPDLWVAQSWNNWRTLRILVNRILLLQRAGSDLDLPTYALIQELSTDICISTSAFARSPRRVSLIWPLSVVAQELANPYHLRFWATEQLKNIGSTMGFRQAGVLADDISKRLSGEPVSTWKL